MKKTFIFFCKLAISGILALGILSVFSLIYYNPPFAEAQPDRFTNNRFQSNSFWSFMTEGFGFGVTNDIGYNSPDDFDPQAPSIAVIGSSHTEALQVPQSATFVAQLQQRLLGDNDPSNDFQCLNLGISGHFFNISVSNFPYFAESFDNISCAVIETSNLSFSAEQLENMLTGTYHSDLAERGTFYSLMQRIPYMRLLYKQYQDSRQKSAADASAEPEAMDYDVYAEGVEKVLKKLADIAGEKGFDLAIVYHNAVEIQDGVGFRNDDPRLLEIFQNSCKENGIRFIDVTDRFVEHYNSTYELPRGFSNTTLGSGHLNELGHRIIADELYAQLAEIAEDK